MRIIGLAVFVFSLPLFYVLMNGSPAIRRYGWFAIGLAPFVIGYFHLEVSIVSWAFWPGYVKGIIVSLLDSLSIAILLTTRAAPGTKYLLLAYIGYFLASAVASLFATPLVASLMFSWQLARAILVFAAVARVARHPEGAKQIIGGLSAGIAFQAVFSIIQRFEGVTQASGTFGHQNLLGLASHFALLLSLASMMAGDRRWLPVIGVVGGGIAVMLTGSRATTGLAGAGLVALVILSLLRHRTAFKMRVAGIGFAVLLVGAPVALFTLQHRFAVQSDSGDYDERRAFETAARAMWADHPMGVGANQYVVKANTGGYSNRAGVAWVSASRNANVHNTYLLIGAETGYLGLVSFLVLFGLAIVSALRLAWSRPRRPNGEIALGAAVTLIVVALHCLYEWVFVTWIIQYLFAITLGLIAGLSAERRTTLRRRREHHDPGATPEGMTASSVALPRPA
ncbi:O-antigen ligase family protein [Sphingomonas sp. MA1305]|uniref:O-antigen ligase family protein n=1 Tax=Sphingomonas sp. MA1305 TaxID=2479204 RepID=UPI001E5163BB|nr:O-antigen ligase family protein [Sphingomonas sp. MA1305]